MLLSWLRFNAKRASLVQSRIKQLERLPELKPVEKETEVTLKFPDVEKLSPPILMLSEVSFAYTNDQGVRGPTVFSKVSPPCVFLQIKKLLLIWDFLTPSHI